jgi:hypothetical protein
MSSASEEELEKGIVNVNEWQQVKNNKRRKINTSQPYFQNTDITISNRFNSLLQDEGANQTNPENKIPKPPLIFIYGILNYNEMVNKLTEIVEQEQYSTKCTADNTIKINCNTLETYRKLVVFLKENNTVHHIYQLKEESGNKISTPFSQHKGNRE